jgi:hypothetical protein
MSKPLVRVELLEANCPKRKVEQRYTAARRFGQPCFMLSPDFSVADLQRILEEHVGARYFTELLHVLAVHPHATGRFLEAILEHSDDSGVLNAVVTSPKVTAKLLSRLRRSNVKSVAQHAELGLLHRKMTTAKASEIKHLLERFPGDEGISLGVRGMVAAHKRTPTTILRALREDSADFVCELALENLEKRSKR